MKNLLTKILVIALGLSLYVNVDTYFAQKQQQEKIELLESVIDDLEELNASQSDPDSNICTKLYEINITVINDHEDRNTTISHCTNELYLGDVLDELQDEMMVVYDPNYSKDYIYGRLVHSFYGMSKEFEEYYAITVDGVYASTGIDFIEISDGSEYTFTLTRWG